MAKFTINTKDKPHLDRLAKEDPDKVKEIIRTFVSLMEDAANSEEGIPWYELAEKLSPQLTLNSLVRGILHGAMDVRAMNEDAFAVLREELHPLSMFSPRKNYLDDGYRVWDWKEHFKLPESSKVDEATVANIIRTLLYHAKYINVAKLQDAYDKQQITAFRGLDSIYYLQFRPALDYQIKQFGDLHMGKMFQDIGLFDCGMTRIDAIMCPACHREKLIKIGKYRACNFCNAGFTTEKKEV